MEFLYLIPFLVVSLLLWWREREFNVERDGWRLERLGLLNRIQHPQVLQAVETPEPPDVQPYLPYDDDEAWNDYVEQVEQGEVS